MTSALMIRTFIATVAFLGSTTGANSQDGFPTRPVRLISTEAGGGSDLYARLIAQGLTKHWDRQVIVENRPSVVAIETLIRAQPDGYSILIYSTGLWIGPILQKATYDPLKDVAPVTIAVIAPNVVAVNPSVPVNSVQELIALAKAKPGMLNYGSGGAGSGGHLATELFNYLAGVNIVRVPFKGAGPAMNAMISGDIQLMFTTAGTAVAHMKTGKIRPLAVTTAKPSAIAPDLPTVASALPGYEFSQFSGIFAPAKTPPALVRKIHQALVAALGQQEMKERLLTVFAEPVGSTPEGLSQAMKSEMARFAKVFKTGGIKQQ